MNLTVTKRTGRAALAVSLATMLALIALAGALVCAGMNSRASVAVASPSAPEPVEDDLGFPEVDWEHWAEVNPDVVGWLTVPGTDIDYPVVQAPADDPDRYLTHDVYGKVNYAGAVYLDAECVEGGLLGGCNAVIGGHNVSRGDARMLADFANYSDIDYASSHRTILLQTPGEKLVLDVVAADVIDGTAAMKRTSFADQAEFGAWLENTVLGADVALSMPADGTQQVFTFATCSYNYWSDERTVVYAVEREATR